MVEMMAGTPPISHDVTLVDAVHILRERIRFMLGMTAAIFLLMTVVILADEPVYRAYITLAPSSPLVDPRPAAFANGLPGVSNSGDLGVFQARTSANHAFALLQSKMISRRFIEAENLLPILFADQWDSETGRWRETNIGRQPTLNDALELFESEVRFITKDSATGFIRINIEWSDGELAANWANRLVDMTDKAIRERDILEAKQSIQFLRGQIEDASLEPVRQLMYQLIESHAKTVMVASIKENYAFTVIDPAVTLESGDTINMPISFKLSLALIFSIGCGVLYAFVTARYKARDL